MSIKARYILYNILDFGLTWGGTAGVIVYNYITPDNSLGFKLSFTGIILVIALILTAKKIFEVKYQNKMNDLLQELASATDVAVKEQLNKDINAHKQANAIYQRLVMLLPFAILYVVTYLGAIALEDLQATLGLILVSMGAGSVFNIIKKPLADKVHIEKIKRRIGK